MLAAAPSWNLSRPNWGRRPSPQQNWPRPWEWVATLRKAWRFETEWSGLVLICWLFLDFTHFFRKCLRNQALSRFSFLKYPAFWTTWPWLSHFLLQQSMLPKLASLIPKWSSLKQPIPIYIHLPTSKPKQHWHPTNWDMLLPCFQPYQHHFRHFTVPPLKKKSQHRSTGVRIWGFCTFRTITLPIMQLGDSW